MSLPMLNAHDAAAITARSGQYGFRCFFGIHTWAGHYWPIGARWRISVHVICTRCGWLKDIHLLNREAPHGVD